jgi:hypothetical protein
MQYLEDLENARRVLSELLVSTGCSESMLGKGHPLPSVDTSVKRHETNETVEAVDWLFGFSLATP